MLSVRLGFGRDVSNDVRIHLTRLKCTGPVLMNFSWSAQVRLYYSDVSRVHAEVKFDADRKVSPTAPQALPFGRLSSRFGADWTVCI